MDRFQELLALLQNPGEDGTLPDTIYDDLTAVYSDVHNRAEGADAKVAEYDGRISEYDAKIQEYESEISRLKAMNYDLLMASGVESGGNENDGDGDESDDDNHKGIDSLF